MRVVVAGASGFVGQKLVPRLAEAGHQVVALSRHPDPEAEAANVEFQAVDAADRDALAEALGGADAAYYLIHSMAGDDFVRKDRELAEGFAEAAAAAGVGRIVYQGALGRGKLSPHLSSRQEVGKALASTGVPVVELRAAVILGSGSTSFEMMRYLTERLPMMICPRWVRTRTEPVALSDVLEYLVRGLEAPPGVYEIGCGQATTYQDMMHLYAEVRGLRYRPILNVPLLTLHLSTYWVDLVTPLDRKVTHSLIGSMSSNVTVRDAGRTLAAFRLEPLPLRDSMKKALDDQAEQVPKHMFDGRSGLSENVHWVYLEQEVDPEAAGLIRKDLAEIGGDLAWYGWPWAWRARFLLGLLFGEHHPISRPGSLAAGQNADWWVIEETSPDSLILKSAGWLTGEGWLGYAIPPGGTCLKVSAAFRPRGLPGFLYWFLLTPVHKAAFKAMAKARVRRAYAIRRASPDPS
jgi:uncharacterized protein YbjT (DUF2867 family)